MVDVSAFECNGYGDSGGDVLPCSLLAQTLLAGSDTCGTLSAIAWDLLRRPLDQLRIEVLEDGRGRLDARVDAEQTATRELEAASEWDGPL